MPKHALPASDVINYLVAHRSRRNRALERACWRYLSSLNAAKGGKASAALLTPEQRQAKARSAVSARWSMRPRAAGELPIDQAQVMARLSGLESVTLRIAPGAGGRRRLNAILSLERSGKVSILSETTSEITISQASSEPTPAK